MNDSAEDIRATARIAREAGAREVHVLPFHQLGESKWAAMGMDYTCASLEPPSPEAVAEVQKLFEDEGLSVNVGGSGND